MSVSTAATVIIRRTRPQPGAALALTLFTVTPILVTGCPVIETPATVVLQRVADGLTSPVALVEPNDGTGRLFIVDQVGLVRVLTAEDGLIETPFLDLRSRLVALNTTYDERGLLSIAFHPAYAANGRFFVTYNAPKGDSTPAEFDSDLRLSEFRASTDPNIALAGSERILLTIPKPQGNHNGGQLAFGPDGMLYLSVGDGGGANDAGTGHHEVLGNGQDLATLLGKVLRIDVTSEIGDYSVPADNPFVAVAGARPEIWAYGLRNPWRFSFDLANGNRLFLADAGQNLFEEVSIVVRGGNYGWRIREGSSCFNANDAGRPLEGCADVGPRGDPLIDPIIEFAHTNAQGLPAATVVIGGYVYRGSRIDALRGRYVFADFTSVAVLPNGRLFAATEAPDGTWSHELLALGDRPNGSLGYVLALGQDLAGEVYVLTSGNLGPVGSAGAVHRLEPAP